MNIRKGRRGLEGKVRDRPRPTIINPFHARGLPSRVIGSDIPFKHVGIKLNEPYSRLEKNLKQYQITYNLLVLIVDTQVLPSGANPQTQSS